MKRLLTIIVLATATAVGYSQNSNGVPSWVDSPITKFLSDGTNWHVASYGIYDTDTHEVGLGIGAGYKVSDYVVPTLRLDYIRGDVYVPSGNLQLQVPILFFDGKVKVTPFVTTGVATTLNSGRNDGNAIGIFGTGGYVMFNHNKSAYVPKGVIADVERWTGGGFDTTQVRFGLIWKLW